MRSGAFESFDADCFVGGQFHARYNPANLTLTIKAPEKGDMNCDCVLSENDVEWMSAGLVDPGTFGGCDILRGDMDSNGLVDGLDIQAFTNVLVN